MGSVHAAAWRQCGATLAGIHAQDHPAAVELARREGTAAFESLDALLESSDVIDVCAPTHLHRQFTEIAAKAGKHVICEKPIALTTLDGEAMITACEQAGVRLFIAMVVRFFPQYQRAWEVVKSGGIGPPSVARFSRISYPPSGRGDNWFADEARSGGMLLDLMIHDFDAARWFSGEVKRVYAQRAPYPAGDAREYALVTLHHANGSLSLVEGGWAGPPGLFRTGFEVAGPGGVVEWSSDAPPSVLAFLDETKGGPAAVGLPPAALGTDPYALEIAHVHAALESGAPFAVTPHDALQAVRIALAARESSKSGQPVKLSPNTLEVQP